MSEEKKHFDLADLYGEIPLVAKDTPNKEQTGNFDTAKKLADDQVVFPVYILHRVIVETIIMCQKAIPNEAIGILLGYKLQFQGKKYVKVVDWVTGNANQSHAFAEFTPEGVRQYTTLIEERYGDCENRPRIVGIIHSHPFGSNPHFSSTDYNTFLNFPYDAEHNVFVLVDPKSGYYKTYIIVLDDNEEKQLEEVDWIEYNVK